MRYGVSIRSLATKRPVRMALLAIICAIVGGLATPALAAPLRQADTLPPPTNLQASPGKDHISLQWDAVSGVRVNYNIYRGTKSHGEAPYFQGDSSPSF